MKMQANENESMRKRIHIASLLVLTVLCVVLAAVSAWPQSQTPVPTTAREAAKMPEFAARLAAARAANKSQATAPPQTTPAALPPLPQSGQPELAFVTPSDGDTVASSNLLIWVGDTLPGVQDREVLFQWSTDGAAWNTIPQQNSPDFGPDSYTTIVDTTTLPLGPLYLRASASPPLSARESPATIQVTVQQLPQVSCLLKPTGEPGAVAFDCSASRAKNADGVLREYRWDFGDGSSMVTHRSAARHTYGFGRTYTFQLSATDDLGLSSSLRKKVVILADGSTDLPQQDDLYSNGPYNGTLDGWTINFGFSVSDSFTVPNYAEIEDFHFVYWDASSSDLLTTADLQVGATSFGGSATTVAFSSTFLGTNQYGYNLYQADSTGLSIPWAGAGYITLSNACSTSGCSVSNPIYWDENGGKGCPSPGCPSQAYENTLGSIPSESFTVTGEAEPPDCEVLGLTLRTTGPSEFDEPRSKLPSRKGEPIPLGPDPDYVSFNFEVDGTLAPGSDPLLCSEGQYQARTASVHFFKEEETVESTKGNCIAGRKEIIDCDLDTQCDTSPGAHDGKCKHYPFPAPGHHISRGDDDYHTASDVKTHILAPAWVDMPGAPRKLRVGESIEGKPPEGPDILLSYLADFLATLTGYTGATNASCHFTLHIAWNGSLDELYSTITLIQDAETQNCTLAPLPKPKEGARRAP